MPIKFHHIAFTVNDINESKDWYEQKLGFKEISRYSNGEMTTLLLENGDIKIELFSFKKESHQPHEIITDFLTDLKIIGTKHLCIEVDYLDNYISDLKQKGVSKATEIDSAAFGGRYVFIKDCNGIFIELYES